MSLDPWLKENKFMYFFEISTYADSCCCFSLKTGVRILSFVSFFFSFLGIFVAPNIISFALTALSLVGSGFLIYSTANDDYRSGFAGYFIYMLLMYLDILKNLAVIILIFIKPSLDTLMIILLYLLAMAIVYTIQTYFIWLFYSFAHSVKVKQPNAEPSASNTA